MKQTTPIPESRMMQILLGKWISKPVHVAAQLGIADLLDGGSMHITDIAAATATSPAPLYRMLRALACVEIFTETKPCVFENTPLSQSLMAGRLKAAALMFHSEWHDRTWDNLLYSLQTGKAAFEKVHGRPPFDWFRENPEEAKTFHEANAFKAASTHRAIIETCDFSGIETITDVGGGLGSLLVAILEAHAHITGIVADVPEVVREARNIIQHKQLANRMRAVECDFFKQVPGTSDAVLLSHVLHDWPDEACTKILKNCRNALSRQGRLFIVEAVLQPGNAFSTAKLLDLEVLLMGGGRERSAQEFDSLLQSAGFHLSRIIQTNDDVSVIEGIPLW